MPKESLCELLEEKITEDSKESLWQLELSTELVRFRFLRNKHRMKLYREYWKENEAASNTPLLKQYVMYKTLR